MKKFSLVLILFFMNCAYAETGLEVEAKFEKKAPFVGLVYFSEDKSLADSDQRFSLDQEGKKFSSKLVIVPKGKEVAFYNSDEIDHNIFADDKENNVKFDVGLIPPSGRVKKEADWPDGSITRVGCKIHPAMRSYIAVISSQYNGVIDFPNKTKSCTVSLSNVPATLKKVRVWFPRFETIEIEVPSGKSVTVEIKKKGKDKIYGKLTLTRS